MALNTFWLHTPPAALQLRRIALALGIKLPEPTTRQPARTAKDSLEQALAAGIPVMQGLPDDPLLKFLEL